MFVSAFISLSIHVCLSVSALIWVLHGSPIWRISVRARDYWSGGCEFKPHWGQFSMKFILCCVTLDLSDNLTEMRQIGLSWKTQLFWYIYLCIHYPIPFEYSKRHFCPTSVLTYSFFSVPFFHCFLKVAKMNFFSGHYGQLSVCVWGGGGGQVAVASLVLKK